MRKRITLLLFSVAVLAATAAVSQSAARPTATSAALASCTPGALNLVTDGQLTIGTDNPAYPPWCAGG
jgi:polar amino acid transport system substrate-binding protein